jgi:hypothetical protein
MTLSTGQVSWPKNAIRAGISRLAPIPLLGDPSRRGAMTVFTCAGQKPSVGPYRRKSQSMAESPMEAVRPFSPAVVEWG